MLVYILFVLGIFLLLKGADYLVEGSSSLAKKLKVSTLVIGLTVVAFGTSMPELVVNLIAAIGGNGDIAFGNIVGSNIANILLILGITGTITSLKVQNSTIWKELPFSLLAAIALLLFTSTFILDGIALKEIMRFEGVILLLFFIIFLSYIFELSRKNRTEFVSQESLEIKKLSSKKIILYILGGIIALYFGGKWTVDGAVSIARLVGMSEYFISLTIIAIGTSLPELITSVVAAFKKDADLAIGNIIGSNIFNILWVLGLGAIITPITIPTSAIFDVAFLIFSTILLFIFMFIGKRNHVDRWQGVTLLVLYIFYLTYLIFRG